MTFYGLWVLEKAGVIWDLNGVSERVYQGSETGNNNR